MSEPGASQVYPGRVIAELLEITPRRLQQLAKDGVVPKVGRGRYPLVGCVRGYVRYLRAQRAELSNDEEFERARTREKVARAEMAELELAEKRGHLLHIDDLERAVVRPLSRLRVQLRSLPGILAPRLTKPMDVPEVLAILEPQIDEFMRDLATTDFSDPSNSEDEDDGR